jgi:uncharacterized GH25 family protein
MLLSKTMRFRLSHTVFAVFLTVVLLGFAGCDAYTSVHGTVVDNNGKPVAGATVRLTLVNSRTSHRTSQMSTGPDGKFSVELIHGPFSRFELAASMSGYEDYRQEIRAKTTTTIQIGLIPQKR